MNFAETIKEARKRKDMTQEQLAKKTGVHRVTIARLETGESECSVSTLFRLSDALGLPVDDLHQRRRQKNSRQKVSSCALGFDLVKRKELDASEKLERLRNSIDKSPLLARVIYEDAFGPGGKP